MFETSGKTSKIICSWWSVVFLPIITTATTVGAVATTTTNTSDITT